MSKYNNADICEEAHKRTVAECKDNDIVCDLMDNGEMFYTPLAQIIFDKHHTEIEQEIDLIDYQKSK